MKYFCSPKIKGSIGRPVRLGVRTPGFHPGSRGSNPLRATKFKDINKMAHHKSSLKRIRQNEKKRGHNKYYAKTTRNAIKALRNAADKAEAEKLYPGVASMIDRLAKKNIIHKNKAANLKSKLSVQVNQL